MEFPVYQYIVATASRILGTSLEPTARGVSLFSFLATIPAVFGLVGLLGLTSSRRLLVICAVLASPTYWFYARTFMIETTALCFSTWFLLATGRAVQTHRLGWTLAATVCGTLAALTKVTTFLIFCPPAAVLFLWLWIGDWRDRSEVPRHRWISALFAAVPVLTATAVGYWWVHYSDHIKDSNPYSGFLTSRELIKWNWGTLAQRVSVEFWATLWQNVSGLALAEVSLAALLIAFPFCARRYRIVSLWCLVFFVGGVLLFSNLFFVHDYYYVATALFLVVGAGFILAGLWANPIAPRPVKLTILAVFVVGQILVYQRGYADYTRRDLPQPPTMAKLIRDTTPSDGVVLIYGWDWNTTIPYYAQRRCLMVPNGREDDIKVLQDILDQLPPRKVVAMLVRNDSLRQSGSFIHWRTDHFNLASAPVASSKAGDLYLPAKDIERVANQLSQTTLRDITLNFKQVANENPSVPVSSLADLDLSMLTPRPNAARAQYGLSIQDLDGRKVLLAHPQSELDFVPPPGAKSISADFGLLPAAYSGNPADATDGVLVEILEQTRDGLWRTLYQRHLTPTRQPRDRGTQHIRLPDAGPFSGRVIFRITPGPTGNFTKDWAYWASIEIK